MNSNDQNDIKSLVFLYDVTLLISIIVVIASSIELLILSVY